MDDFLASRLNEVGLRQGFNAPSVQVHRSVQQISLACWKQVNYSCVFRFNANVNSIRTFCDFDTVLKRIK